MVYPDNFEQKIGFNIIRERLKELCISVMGIENVDNTKFSSDIVHIEEQLLQVEDFRRLLSNGMPFPVIDFFDLRNVFKHLSIAETVIDIESLFALKQALSSLSRIMEFFKSEVSLTVPYLKVLSEGIEINKQIFIDTERLIDDKGEIPDNASPVLAEIRGEIRRKTSSIDRRMQQLLVNAKNKGWTNANDELTIRNGRLVIPVKASDKKSLRGFIHDESATGQTVYIEPAEIFDTNNEIKELEYAERREIHKILLSYSRTLRPELPSLVMAWHLLGMIDYIRAKAIFADNIVAVMPQVNDSPMFDWKQAKHPLLEHKLKSQGKEIVPLDLHLDADNRILIISGPNAGGKSVCLKTAGLLQYMLQCGIAVPMHKDSCCGIFHNMFIDIGDEQSLENDLSTYSSHLLNMKHLLEAADDRTLFLIDEFGSGTEPQLGGAIAEAILLKLNDKKAFGMVTTHYANLKLLADDNEGIINGAMLFDTRFMQPLYIMMTGRPGSSFAFEIARKTGLPKDILTIASNLSGKGHLSFEQQLQQLEIEKKELRKKENELKVADSLLDEVVTKYKKLLADLEKNKTQLMKKANKEAQQLIDNANAKIENTIREIKEAQAEKERTKELRNDLKKMKDKLIKDEKTLEEDKKINSQEKELNEKLKVGDTVCINEMEVIGELIDIKDTDITIRLGTVNLRTTADKVRKISKATARKAANNPSFLRKNIMNDLNEKAANFNLTLDLRGKRGEEALNETEKYIDEAVLLSIKEVNILHGKGNGILRRIIRDFLSKNSNIKEFHDATLETGGTGITKVTLK